MDQRLLAKTALILLASLSASADEFHWNRTSGSGNWHDNTNWTDADGNTAGSYPGENGTTDVAVFHGMGMAGRVYISVPLDLACVRFEDGNQTCVFGYENNNPSVHFHADRFEVSTHATFGYMQNGWQGFQQPSDFTIGNREDLLVNGGLIRGGMNYQNQSGGNWSSRKALGIDENGQLLTNQGNTEMSYDVWNDTTYDSLYGLRTGMWGDFRNVNFNNNGAWKLTLPSGHIAFVSAFCGVGKAADGKQGTVFTGGEPLYFWPTHYESVVRTNYFRAKIDAPTFLQCGFGCAVLFDDHSTETCAYDVTAGILQLGGAVCNGNVNNVEMWDCPLGTGPVHVRWSGTLHVASANALNPASALHIHSYRDRGRNKKATDVIFGQVLMEQSGTVHYFFIDENPMLPGTYGSSASGADNQRDDIFSGPGVLTVLASEGGATTIMLK